MTIQAKWRDSDEDDSMGPAIGIKNAIPLAIICWVIIGSLVWAIIH